MTSSDSMSRRGVVDDASRPTRVPTSENTKDTDMTGRTNGIGHGQAGKDSVGEFTAATAPQDDGLMKAMLATIQRLERRMEQMERELALEREIRQALEEDRARYGGAHGYGETTGGFGSNSDCFGPKEKEGARLGPLSYAATLKGAKAPVAGRNSREVRVTAGRQEIVVSTVDKDMVKRSAKELLQATRSVWGEKAILRARPLTGGRAALTVAPGEAGQVLAGKKLTEVFGPTAKVIKGGLRVIAKGVPLDALTSTTLDVLSEWHAFHLTTRRGHGGCGTVVFSVPTFELAQKLVKHGLKLGHSQCTVEPFDPKIRVRQCFRCWRWGHIGSQCQHKALCGGCGRPSHGAERCSSSACPNCSRQGHGPRNLTQCPVARNILDEGKQAYRQRPLRFAQAAQRPQQPDAATTATIVVEDTTTETDAEEDVFADANTELVADVGIIETAPEPVEEEEEEDLDVEEDEDEDIDMDRFDREIVEAEEQLRAAEATGADSDERAALIAKAIARRAAATIRRKDALAKRNLRRSTRSRKMTAKKAMANKTGTTKSAARPARRQ